ncbi:DUF4153 domain-containing protein, partial [Vibrio sp. FNV 38]|nr:DUF4153 domain-containing protein [Vibrio sp. FNV 38]
LQLLTSAVTGFWLFGILYAGAKRMEEPFPDDAEHAAKAQASRVIPNLGLLTGITPICVLYLIYVFSQMQYFVSAFAGLLPGDMIYSEYARRGFFELCAIAVINLLVLLVLNGCAKESTSRALRIYHFLFCALT